MTLHDRAGPRYDYLETPAWKFVDLDSAGLSGRTAAMLAEGLLGCPQRVYDFLPVE
jgi:hypothetical protein